MGDTGSEFNLTIRQFARICNTSRDTLRYYYEKGLIKPYVDPENGYHYYSLAQVSSFYYVNRLRTLGYSVDEILQVFNSSNISDFNKMIDAKTAEVKNEIKKMQVDLISLKQIQWLINRMTSYDQRFEEHRINEAEDGGRETTGRTAPPLVRVTTIDPLMIISTPIADSAHAWSMKNVTPDIKNHMDEVNRINGISAIPMGASIKLEDLKNGMYRYHDMISFSLKTRRERSSASTRITRLPSKRVLECVLTPERGRNDGYRAIKEKIRQEELTPLSDLYILSLFNMYGLRERHSFEKYMFICIR